MRVSASVRHVILVAIAVLLALASLDAIGLASVATITAALVVLVVCPASDLPQRIPVARIAVVVAGAIVVVQLGVAAPDSPQRFTSLLTIPLVAVVAFVVWRAVPLATLGRWLTAGVLVGTVWAIGFTWIVEVERPAIDVLELHVSASDLLAEGRNPYSDSRVRDTRPDAEPDAEIVGYPYPPLTMGVFVASDRLLGDPRWATVLAVAFGLTLFIRPWSERTHVMAHLSLAAGALLVVQPELGPIIRNGWTDLIALPLVIAAAALWSSRPLAAAALLGFAVASKQYWLLVVPLLVLIDDSHRARRVAIVGGIAGASLLPAFIADSEAAWRSLVTDLVSLAPRSDSLGLAALDASLSAPAVLVICAVLAWRIARQPLDRSRFLIAVGATLAVGFFLGSQAFVNYWFLVAGLALASITMASDGTDTVQ